MTPSLNLHLDLNPVMKLAYKNAVFIPNTLPAILPCPVCTYKYLKPKCSRIYDKKEQYNTKVTSIPGYGLHWYCSKCGLALDSIELLALVDHYDIPTCINGLLQTPNFNLPTNYFTDSAVAEYIFNYVDARKQYVKWSENSRKKWTSRRDIYDIIANNLHVSVHIAEAQETALRGVGKWLHATTANDLSELGITGLGANFNTCLAIPSCVSPGLPTGLFLFGWKESTKLAQYKKCSADTGILFYDAVPLRPKRIIAVSSPYLAIWLQHKYLQENNLPAAVVVWNEDTAPCIWKHIDAEEIVFWSYTPNPALFKQALSVPGSTVAWINKPVFSIEYEYGAVETQETWNRFYRLVNTNVPAANYVHALTGQRRDTYEAFTDHLLTLGPEDASSLVNYVGLEQPYTNLLLDKADKDTKLKLNELLNAPEKYREAIIGSNRVIQAIRADDTGWYICKRKRNELVSNAVLHITKSYSSGDIKYYDGVVYYRGKAYSVTTDEPSLARRPILTLMQMVEKVAGESPIISKSHERKLWDFIWQFSGTVPFVSSSYRVGWDTSAMSFITPRFTISNGKIVETECTVVNSTVLPCRNVGPIVDIPQDRMKELIGQYPENAAMWAVLTALFTNMWPRDKQPPKPIIITGKGALAAIGKIAVDLQLICVSGAEAETDVAALDKLQAQHDLPVFVRANKLSSRFVNWLATPTPKNIIVTADALSAKLAGFGDYTVVNYDQECDISHWPNVTSIVFNFMAYLQRQLTTYSLLTRPSRTMMKWIFTWIYDDVTALRHRPMFQDIGECITEADQDNHSIGYRFVKLLRTLITDGYLTYSAKPITGVDVMRDDDNGIVHVYKNKLISVVSVLRWPILDLPNIIESLYDDSAVAGEMGDNSEILLIHSSYWDMVSQQVRDYPCIDRRNIARARMLRTREKPIPKEK